MSEIDPSYLEQALKRDRIKQFRNGIAMQHEIQKVVEHHGGYYDFEVGVREEDEIPVIERVDRKVVKAMGGALQGIYRELVAFGEKEAADHVIFESHREPQ